MPPESHTLPLLSQKTLDVPSAVTLGPVTPEEARLLELLDLLRLPRHLAVIMDGNGRWAQKRHLPRIAGIARGRRRRAPRLKPARGCIWRR